MVHWDVPRLPTSVLVMVDVAAEHGVSVDECLRGSKLNPDRLRQPGSEVTARQERVVIRNLIELLGEDRCLGLEAGSRYHLTMYGIWGFAMLSSPSLRSAIDLGLRFLDLTFALTTIEFRMQDGEAQLVMMADDLPSWVRQFAIERDAAAMQVIQKELFTEPVNFHRASFTFAAPRCAQRFGDVFEVAPEFEASENFVAFDPALLDRPLPRANEHTRALAQQECQSLLQQRHARTGLSGRVRELIVERISVPPDADSVAHELTMSPRTLRHHLAAEGTSFRQLLDEVREGLAEEMLVTGGMTVAETAQRLGYVELSSFSQAFRRWKGMGPRDFRSRGPMR